MINYTFLKSPFHGKMCKFSLNASDAKFLRKNCAIGFLMFKAFQRAIKSRNPMS